MSGFPILIVEGIHRPGVVEQAQIRKAVMERRGYLCSGEGADRQNGHSQYSGLGVPHDVDGTVPLVRVDTEVEKVVYNKMLVVVLREGSMARNLHRDFWRTVQMVATAIHLVAPH